MRVCINGSFVPTLESWLEAEKSRYGNMAEIAGAYLIVNTPKYVWLKDIDIQIRNPENPFDYSSEVIQESKDILQNAHDFYIACLEDGIDIADYKYCAWIKRLLERIEAGDCWLEDVDLPMYDLLKQRNSKAVAA